jgi:cyclic pyranopterin phosphate synthase
MHFLPRAQLLTFEDLVAIGRAFVELGVRKIRVTGGEPLVRRNLTWLLRELASLPGLDELALTTNGTQLERLAGEIREAGVRRLNVSLDTLRPERFRRMTRVGELDRVLGGIEAACTAGFRRIRLNAVVLRGYNDDEVPDLVEFAVDRGMDIAFIEEMPLGLVGDHDRAAVYCSSDEVRAMVQARYTLLHTTERTGGPAVYFRVGDTRTHVGFISPHSHNFCDTCNRVRLTTEGRLLLCLGQEHSVDLRHVVRANPGDREALRGAIRQSMAIKPRGHEFALQGIPVILRHMSATGG